MKVLLAIPSYNRPYEIEKKTGFWLKKLVDIDWKIFVREDQYIYYSQVIPEENLITIEVNSFRETINAMGNYARENNYDVIHFVADDMSFKKQGRAKKKDTHLVYQELYVDIVEKFKTDQDVYGISVAKPMTHLRRDKTKTWGRENKALYGNIFLRSEIMNMPENIEVFQDIFSSLVILSKGKKTLTYLKAYEDAIMLKNSGGLQSNGKRNQLATKTLEQMKKMFPNVRQGAYMGNTSVVDIDLKYLGIK